MGSTGAGNRGRRRSNLARPADAGLPWRFKPIRSPVDGPMAARRIKQMKPRNVLLACAACLLIGASLGLLASDQSGVSLFAGKAPKEAGQAALAEAEKVAGDG